MKNSSSSNSPKPGNLPADILLVEDDLKDAELTLDTLKQCGFDQTVVHVTDGAEALEYIACTGVHANRHPPVPPKLILLDLGLLGKGGLLVLRQLKADEHTRGIPIVVLTGSALAIQLLESYRLGVNSYVVKPTSAPEFKKTVAAIGDYWLKINTPPGLSRTAISYTSWDSGI
jgi:two-component system, response regulator